MARDKNKSFVVELLRKHETFRNQWKALKGKKVTQKNEIRPATGIICGLHVNPKKNQGYVLLKITSGSERDGWAIDDYSLKERNNFIDKTNVKKGDKVYWIKMEDCDGINLP